MGIPNEHIIPMQGCDHCEICRFADQSSNGYRVVRNTIEEVATDAARLQRAPSGPARHTDWLQNQSGAPPRDHYPVTASDRASSLKRLGFEAPVSPLKVREFGELVLLLYSC